MSLVNDMLRDLDARRQKAPSRGIGAERLVPASDSRRRDAGGIAGRVLTIAFILLAGVAGAAVAMYLSTLGSGSAPVPVTPDRIAAPAAERIEDSASRSVADSSPSPEVLAALNERLQVLEEQNRQLLAQTDSTTLSQGPAAEPSVNDSDADSPVLPDNNSGRDWQARDWATASETDARSAEEAGTRVSTPRQDSVQSQEMSPEINEEQLAPMRSPREMSFSDRDRQQAQEALSLWSDGQQNQALEMLDQFALDNPRAHQSRELMAKLLLQRGENSLATQVTDIGLQIAPQHDGYRKIRARLLLSENRSEEAFALLDRAVPPLRNDREYHDLLANAALAARHFDTALRTYEHLLDDDAEQGRWWYGLAASLDSMGRASQAAQAYERAIQTSNLSSGLRQTSQQRLAQIRQ